MKYIFIFTTLLCFSCTPKTLIKNDNNSKSFDKVAIANEFINLVKNNDNKAISKKVIYPLNRAHPLPEVKNQEDFLLRYDEIFDANFREMIANSDPSTDWDDVGAKGIMFKSGKLWLDFSGQLFAVNYQSAIEKEKSNALLMDENPNLHSSVRVFEKSMLEMETKSFKIRVDNVGDYKYRYAAWTPEQDFIEEPFLLLEDGKRIREGSGGNHRFTWDNGPRRYEVFVIVLGAKDSPPALLNVYEGSNKLIEEEATEFKN